ncbi:MAG: alpha-glucosidase C-terminal domain-containing protein [Clostridiales bacterium]|nr:alpha-glucosidase C-terminal domain-containing protein [Clostridiales bacterium]
MAWFDEAIFYHIYPLGLTGAPKQNSYGAVEHRLNSLIPWIDHIREIGCNALYIGPLFESVGHGYETTDYRKLDCRLGDNEDLKNFVAVCHEKGIRVIFDGVFNHTGRDFFAFQDIRQNRENSRYKDWYCNVNFWGNNEYNDGFSYENWGGYNLLVKLNQKNPEVIGYICDVIRFWVSEFDVDGIRLDAADVLDMQFMQALRGVANEVKPDFWLMGEVIHGEYSRWVNEGTLHSVTNYHLHKALYSGHNDHNYFEIAHTVRRLYDMGGRNTGGLKLYNFVDNHDVERIYTKLSNKAHFAPVHILLYTLPGIPSLYYGSEFGIEGRKERFSDDSLRPALCLEDFADAVEKNPQTSLIAALGKIRKAAKSLSYGDYKELTLTNRQYAFSRSFEGQTVLVTVNNDDQSASFDLPAGNASEYIGALSGERVKVNGGRISVTVRSNYGEIWVPGDMDLQTKPLEPVESAKVVMEEKPEDLVEPEEAVVLSKNENMTKNSQGNINGKKSIEKSAEPVKQEKTVAAARTVKKPEQEKQEESGKKTGKQKELTNSATGTVVQEKDSADTEKAESLDKVQVPTNKSYEEMTVKELQAAILAKMAKNGPVTDDMYRTVEENIWHDSLVNWVKSFR